MGMQAEFLKKRLMHLILRERAAKDFGEKKTFGEVRQGLRQFKKQGDLEMTIDSLLESELTVETRRAAVMGELNELLRKKFPNIRNLTIVLLGSGAHGGAVVRDLVGHVDKRADLDWGLIADGDDLKSSFLRTQIYTSVVDQIVGLGKKHGLGESFHSCLDHNGKSHHASNLETTNQALELMKEAKLENMEALALYFQPSFPPEVNQKNRAVAILALQELARTNKPHWETVVQKLLKTWRDMHTLRQKHVYQWKFRLPAKMENKTRRMVDEILPEANQLMSEPFEQLIRSTGN